jgi:hypothetical protein
MPFNDTTNKTGLIQDCEFWTNLGDATISGDDALKAVFTRLINIHFASLLAKVQVLTGKNGPEDINYPDQQFSYFDIESGVNDYQFLTDEHGNTITDITGVLIQPSGSSDYVSLDPLALSDSDALLVMSPNASNTGTPTGFIEKNNTVFFDKLPDYDAANGGKLFYRLVPSYFVASDTSKRPGIVEGYHRLLSLGPSYDWLLVNKPESTTLITRIESKLSEMSSEFADYIRQKNPTRTMMTVKQQSSR